MPQILAVVFAGVGIYAGAKWLSRKIEAAARELAEIEQRRRDHRARAPTDLGQLDYDPESKVYKPRGGGRPAPR